MPDPTTMSEAFVLALIESEDLMTFIREGADGDIRIYAAGSLGQGQETGGNPPAPKLPYVVWNELPSAPHRVVEEVSNAQHRFFTFHVYDEGGSLSTITSMLMLIRDVIKDLAPFVTTDEGRCIESRWLGFSGFIPDPEYDSTVRFGTARLQTSQ